MSTAEAAIDLTGPDECGDSQMSTAEAEAEGREGRIPKPKPPLKQHMYWVSPLDDVHFHTSQQHPSACFTIRGDPQALRRPAPRPCFQPGHRSVYNPSKGSQELFRNALIALMPAEARAKLPVFPSGLPVSISVVFLLRRPDVHFVNRNRESEMLKMNAPHGYVSGKSDIDNMLKFILDCMNKIIYNDDRQVVEVHVKKQWDSDGCCEGSTLVHLSVALDGDVAF